MPQLVMRREMRADLWRAGRGLGAIVLCEAGPIGKETGGTQNVREGGRCGDDKRTQARPTRSAWPCGGAFSIVFLVLPNAKT